LLSAEQVEAGLLLRLFPGRWFGSVARVHAALPARLPFRRLWSFASPLNRRWRLGRSTASILVSSTGCVVAIGWSSASATAPYARAPTTQSPALRRGGFGRWPAFCATNDVSMDALFAGEVQFFVRRSGRVCGVLCRKPRRSALRNGTARRIALVLSPRLLEAVRGSDVTSTSRSLA
jgi:hypothetical protein